MNDVNRQSTTSKRRTCVNQQCNGIGWLMSDQKAWKAKKGVSTLQLAPAGPNPIKSTSKNPIAIAFCIDHRPWPPPRQGVTILHHHQQRHPHKHLVFHHQQVQTTMMTTSAMPYATPSRPSVPHCHRTGTKWPESTSSTTPITHPNIINVAMSCIESDNSCTASLWKQ